MIGWAREWRSRYSTGDATSIDDAAAPALPTRSDRVFPVPDSRADRPDRPARPPPDDARGEVLIQAGDSHAAFFVVLSGTVNTWSRSKRSIVTHRAGQFSGEATMITGRRAMARLVRWQPAR